MLLEHLVVGSEPAPPTTAELCTTSVNMGTVGKSGPPASAAFFLLVPTLFRAPMAISLCGLFKLRQPTCVGHTAVFCGRRGRLRLRGASVPFWLVVVWWRGGLWLGVCREARGPVVLVICWELLAGFTHTPKGTHQPSRSRHSVIFIHCTLFFYTLKLQYALPQTSHSHQTVIMHVRGH